MENIAQISDKSITRGISEAAIKLDTKIYYEPLNGDGYLIPASATLSGKQEIYINSRLSPEKLAAVCWLKLNEAKHGFGREVQK